MKKLGLILVLAGLLCSIISGVVMAAKDDIIPCNVVIKVNDDANYAKLKGLKVRINNKKSEFFSHSFFITLGDLKKLAKRRKVTFKLDQKANILFLGKRKLGIIKVEPKSKDKFQLNKVRSLKYKGKMYFDTWGIYPGLGFSSVSRTSEGVLFYDPKLKKKK